jgi:HK97 family phage major capsid protein
MNMKEESKEETKEESVLEYKEHESKQPLEINYRDFQIESQNTEARTVEMSVSSEAPVLRNWGGVEGNEILDHSNESINLERFESGSAPLLMDHDPSRQIGVIDSIRLDSTQRKLRATARFGNSLEAKEAYADVMDRIRTNVSIGYHVNNYVQEVPENRSETPTFRVTDWTLLEVSSVSIPSDFKVGIGRNENQKPSQYRTLKMENTIEETMEKSVVEDPELRERLEKEALKGDRKRAKEIYEIAGRHQIPSEIVEDAIYGNPCSVADFRGIVLDYREKQGSSNVVNALENTGLGMTPKDVQRFSIANLLWAEANPHDRRAQEEASFERDVCAEYSRSTDRTGKGMMIPEDVIMSKKFSADALNQRDWNTTNATGGYLIQTDVISFIDRLRHYLFLTDVGVQELRGLRGPVNIPRLTASQTAHWVTEGNAPAESQGTLDQVSLSPKTVGAYAQVTRRLLEEAKETPDVEALIVDDMARQIAAAIQDKAMSGDGSSGTPTGLYNSSIGSVSFGTANDPTWAETVSVWGNVAGNRALSLPRDQFAWAFSSTPAQNMMAKSKDTGSGTFVLDTGMEIMGYPVYISELCSGVTFGAFSQMILAYWSGLDILSDPYTNGSAGTVNFYALQDIDVGVRLPSAFCKGA